MKKNCVMFFETAIVGVVAVFLFVGAGVTVGAFVVPKAHAYAIGATATTTTDGTSAAGASAGTSYDIGSSLQNLISPFTGFINSLKFNNNTTINANSITNAVGGGTNSTGFTWPTVNITPVLESGIQNTVSQWLSQFDSWVYQNTGVQLSGIFVVILNLFSWVLGLAQQAVNWLLGLFH